MAANTSPCFRPMSITELSQLLHAALECQRKHDLEGAKARCHQALTIHPDHPDVLHMLGIIAYAEDDLEAAEILIRRAQAKYPHRHAAIERNLEMVVQSLDLQRKLQPFCAEAIVCLTGRINPYQPIFLGTNSQPAIDVVADMNTTSTARKVSNLINQFTVHGLVPPSVWHAGITPASGTWSTIPQPAWEKGLLPSGQIVLFMGLDLQGMEWLEDTQHNISLLYCDELDYCKLQQALEIVTLYGKRKISLIYGTEDLSEQISLPGETPSARKNRQASTHSPELSQLLALL